MGCEVEFDARQTCCGQPAYNTGYRDEARRVALCAIDVLAESSAEAIVVPSGSCAAMLKHSVGLFKEGDPAQDRARHVGERVHELSSFLLDVLGVTDVGARFDGKLVWHDACHGLRDLGIEDQPRALLRAVQGVELVEAQGDPTCCGFGGTFSVKQPEVSVAMLDQRLETLRASGADAIVSSDVSCLMQLSGRLQNSTGTAVPRALHLSLIHI